MDPTDNFNLILKHTDIISDNTDTSNIILFLLAEILQSTSILNISSLVELFEKLIVKKGFGHPIILNMIFDGLVQVLAYPSFRQGNLSAVEQLVHLIQNNKKSYQKTQTNDFESEFLKLSPDLMNARDISVMLETQPDFQFKLIETQAEKYFWTRNHLVLRGFLNKDSIDMDNWNIVVKNLIIISKDHDGLKSSLVMPLLYKLSMSTNPRMKLAILQNIIELGATTEVFSIIKALSTGLIRTMSIDLHLRLWKKEPRTYPFLHKVLVEQSNLDSKDFGLQMVRAAAIRDICDLRPQHGSDLVSIISEILNSSLDLKDGEIPAAIAIDSIRLLCQNHIINIASTWKAISLKTRYEKRGRVIESLGKFFAIFPSLKRNNLEYENLMKEILGRLWNMIQWSDSTGIQCAINTLKSWNYDAMTLDTIPEVYREGIALPVAPVGMEISILDMEVPGECFVQLLMKVHASALRAAGDLLSHYIGCEISEFRSGHYIVKEGQPEPLNYKTLPKQSILKALLYFVIQQATTKKVEKLVDESVLVVALRILAQKYCRPLPPLNWCFLHDMLHKSNAIKVQCLHIAAKQSIISGTAKRLIENFLVNLDGECCEDVECALDVLVDICNGVSPEILKTFCNFVFKTTCVDLAGKISKCLVFHTDITNRENLAAMLSSYINCQSDLPFDVVKLIPPKILDMISFQLSPCQKIKFRCEILKVNSTVENPIAWLSEMLTEQLMVRDNRDLLIKSLMDLLMESDIFPKKKWLMDFIIMMQNRLVEKDFEEEKIRFLLDIFSISVTITSGYFKVLSCNDDILFKRLQIFPSSIELVSQQPDYNDAMGKIFEFLLHIVNREGDKIPVEFREAFKTAIIISKNHIYFKKAKVWHKFLMMR